MFFNGLLILAAFVTMGAAHVLVSQMAFQAWTNRGCMVVDCAEEKHTYEWIGKVKLIGSLGSAAFLFHVIKDILLRLDFYDGEEIFFSLIIVGLIAYGVHCSLSKMFNYCEQFSHEENIRATKRHVSACKHCLHDAGLDDSSPCRCCEYTECPYRKDG